MVLVLCEPFDTAAYWAAAQLQARDVPTQLITGGELERAVRWEHRISRTGAATVTLTLADGRTVSSVDAPGVLNRLGYIQGQSLGGPDRDYAIQELNALFLSWLHAMPGPMLNRPKPQGLGGLWRHQAEWAVLAGQAGLAVAPYRHTDRTDPNASWVPPDGTTVFVVGTRAVAPPTIPPRIAAGCVRLAALANEGLLGVTLTRARHWQMQGATPRPELTQGGAPLIDALADALGGAPI